MYILLNFPSCDDDAVNNFVKCVTVIRILTNLSLKYKLLPICTIRAKLVITIKYLFLCTYISHHSNFKQILVEHLIFRQIISKLDTSK